MLRWFGTIGAIVVALAIPLFASQAQEFTYRDGFITFDKRGYKAEFDRMQRDLSSGAQARRSKNYCISCYDGSKFNCKAIVGGRVGQGLCLLGGASACNPPGTNGVSAGSCSSGSTGQTR